MAAWAQYWHQLPFPVYETPNLTSHFQTFVVISKGKDIFRFSAEDSMWFLSPFSPVRRVAIHVLVHPLFSLIIIVTILLNCIMMILPPTEQIESTEWVRKLYWFILHSTSVFSGFSLQQYTHLSQQRRWWEGALPWPSSPTWGTPGTGSTSSSSPSPTSPWASTWATLLP